MQFEKEQLYQIQTLEDILPQLANAKVFSVADVRNGYWHVPLDRKSQKLTTFGTPFGRYGWRRMPFGISVAPELFQQRLQEAIENLDRVFAMANDILIAGNGTTYAEAVKDHDKKLEMFLNDVQKKQICLNKDKFRLKLISVVYM